MTIFPTAHVEDGARIGAGTFVWHHAHIRTEAQIGDNCNIGQNVYVGRGVQIGRGCKIQNNVNVYEGVTLEDYVFCGPSMTFTNLSSPLPRAAISRGTQLQKTLVRRGASLGAQCVIVCGVEVGQFAFVAAGSVVIRDVPAYALIAGNPARQIGWTCCCGERLDLDDNGTVTCPRTETVGNQNVVCGRSFQLVSGRLELRDDPHQGATGYDLNA